MFNQEKTYTVEKVQLLDIISRNRENHRAVFEKALEKYQVAMVHRLEQMLGEAREGRRVKHVIDLIIPVDQTKEYDRIIGLLTMSLDDEVEITEQEYRQYVEDDWSWTGQFVGAASAFVQEGELPANYSNKGSWK